MPSPGEGRAWRAPWWPSPQPVLPTPVSPTIIVCSASIPTASCASFGPPSSCAGGWDAEVSGSEDNALATGLRGRYKGMHNVGVCKRKSRAVSDPGERFGSFVLDGVALPVHSWGACAVHNDGPPLVGGGRAIAFGG